MQRREFITLVARRCGGGVAARCAAQQTDRMRRIGVIFGGPNDPDVQTRLAAFVQTLQQLGWTEGRNVRIEFRFGAGNVDNTRKMQRNWLLSHPT